MDIPPAEDETVQASLPPASTLTSTSSIDLALGSPHPTGGLHGAICRRSSLPGRYGGRRRAATTTLTCSIWIKLSWL
jgi:hypothetical protein